MIPSSPHCENTLNSACRTPAASADWRFSIRPRASWILLIRSGNDVYLPMNREILCRSMLELSMAV